MSGAAREPLDPAVELCPAPRRSIPGLGVVRSLQPLAVTLRGFSMDLRPALERRGLDLGGSERQGHELLVERVASPFPGVPPAVASQAYRCAVGVRRSVIHAAGEQGAWYGIATFLQAAELTRAGRALREAMVEDWPLAAWRGVLMDGTGVERMSFEDWQAVLDELGGFKLGALCVRLRDLPEEGLLGRILRSGAARGVRILPSVAEQGACLSDPRGWELRLQACAALIDRSLAPAGADAFHVAVEEADIACACAACGATPPRERLRAYLIRLASFLVSRGMKRVVLSADPGDEDLLRQLRAAGLEEQVLLAQPWSGAVHDPACGIDLARAAELAWNGGPGGEAVFSRLHRRLGGEGLERGLQALELARQNPAAPRITCAAEERELYPLRALEALEAAGPTGRSDLEELEGAAELACELLRKAPAPDRGTVSCLLAEAVRLDALAGAFLGLLDARAILGSGRPAEATGLPAATAERRSRLAAAIAEIERWMPAYLLPEALRELVVLRDLFGRLEGECAEVAAGSRAPATVRWLADPGPAGRV